MKKTILVILASISAFSFAFALEKDPLVGFYRAPDSHGRQMCAEIFRTGTTALPTYRITIRPAIFSRAETYAKIDNLKAEDGTLKFSSNGYSGTATADGVKLAHKHKWGVSNFDLKPFKYVSPTMGQKAPEGAVVLFDGKNFDLWEHFDKQPITWGLENGDMIVKPRVKNAEGKNSGGSIRTKQTFDGELMLHAEFNLPPNYGKDVPGQRANSGIYFGDFEIQVLEGFGFEGNWGDIGAVYRQMAPYVNACLEPGTWQTFDIVFKPAKFGKDGKILLPRFTVFHNGVLVQNETPVKYATALYPDKGAKYVHKKAPFSISIQDHGAPIRYRNIWVRNLE